VTVLLLVTCDNDRRFCRSWWAVLLLVVVMVMDEDVGVGSGGGGGDGEW
jgi:hypothetical protein